MTGFGAWGRGNKRTAPRYALALLCAVPNVAAVPCQKPVPAIPVTIRVQNLAPYPRRQWCSTVVPFPRGAVTGAPELHVEGRATVWERFGAPWPDGSWRQALCLFPAGLEALGERNLALVEGSSPPLPEGGSPLPEFTLTFHWRGGGRSARATPEPVAIVEDNPARRVTLLRCRVGNSGLVAEVHLTRYRGEPFAHAALAVFFSDPSSEAMTCPVDELAVESRGLALLLRNGPALGVRQRATTTGARAVLLRDTVLGDGQGIRRTGALVPPMSGRDDALSNTLKATVLGPPLAATSWRGTGAFGAFGFLPPRPPWLRGAALRRALAMDHAAFARWSGTPGDPLRPGPLGLARAAGQTGDQRDFGVISLEAIAGEAMPSLLLEAEASVLQEACRPVHFFEQDGTMVRAADHPAWIVWSGRTHWHPEVSVDRLGKPHPAPHHETHGWTGKDRQHWSSNHLGTYALLTGEHWARRECAHEVQLFLAGQTLGDHTTSGPGAPRGAGRTLLAASWLYLVTGDPALRQRMIDRVEKVHFPSWVGRNLPDEMVRPFGLQGKDGRILDGKTVAWLPWQDALAAVGFAACHKVTGSEQAEALARGLSLNLLRHGWKVTDREVIIAAALRWKPDGAPPTAAELRKGARATVVWSYGTAFSLWAISSVRLGRAFAAAEGLDDLVHRADRILEDLRAARRPPDHGGYDRFGEWDGARW